ncbi:MAG: hypothetical protein IJU52_02550 [Clostridia bacterium]|nr:hypothetical protein [Clostridia bacterium]
MEQKKPRKPHFISLVKRGLYAVGCTGATAVLYKDDVEIARFKDLSPYSDQAAISPKEDLFVIRSAVGEMAVYLTEPPRLLKKFRFSEIEGQDQGYCFSPDGKYFLSIELQEHPLKTVLSIYETANFTLAGRLFDDDDRLFLEEIEYDEDKGNYMKKRHNYPLCFQPNPVVPIGVIVFAALLFSICMFVGGSDVVDILKMLAFFSPVFLLTVLTALRTKVIVLNENEIKVVRPFRTFHVRINEITHIEAYEITRSGKHYKAFGGTKKLFGFNSMYSGHEELYSILNGRKNKKRKREG